MKVVKIITNVLLIPSVILWMVSGVLFPLSHAVSVYITDVSYFEIILLNVMMYSALVASPLAVFNYLTNVNYKSIMDRIKDGSINEPKDCKSCKKK